MYTHICVYNQRRSSANDAGRPLAHCARLPKTCIWPNLFAYLDALLKNLHVWPASDCGWNLRALVVICGLWNLRHLSRWVSLRGMVVMWNVESMCMWYTINGGNVECRVNVESTWGRSGVILASIST